MLTKENLHREWEEMFQQFSGEGLSECEKKLYRCVFYAGMMYVLLDLTKMPVVNKETIDEFANAKMDEYELVSEMERG